MLEAVLASVAEGGLRSVRDLARQLDVPESLVDTMLHDLARRGYLRAVDSCQQACDHCAADGCISLASGKVWTLTAAGDRLARKLALPGSPQVAPP